MPASSCSRVCSGLGTQENGDGWVGNIGKAEFIGTVSSMVTGTPSWFTRASFAMRGGIRSLSVNGGKELIGGGSYGIEGGRLGAVHCACAFDGIEGGCGSTEGGRGPIDGGNRPSEDGNKLKAGIGVSVETASGSTAVSMMDH